MYKSISQAVLLAGMSTIALPTVASAGGNHALHQTGAILSPENQEIDPNFDILAAHVHRKGRVVTFHMTLKGTAGASVPASSSSAIPRPDGM